MPQCRSCRTEPSQVVTKNRKFGTLTRVRDWPHKRSGHFEFRAPKPETKRNDSTGGEAMAKGPAEFTQQNAERAFQAATVGMDWMRDAAEQGLNQSQAVVRTFLTLARQAGDGFNQQASAVHRSSLALAEET